MTRVRSGRGSIGCKAGSGAHLWTGSGFGRSLGWESGGAGSGSGPGPGSEAPSHLELRGSRLGSLHAPRVHHQELAVVVHPIDIHLQVGRHRLPAPHHARKPPSDEAAGSRHERHDLDRSIRRGLYCMLTRNVKTAGRISTLNVLLNLRNAGRLLLTSGICRIAKLD